MCVAIASIAPAFAVASQARAATPVPLPANATILMPGHGWGHGRGMGQWGANGMARDGSTYRTILTHYYSGIAFAARAAGESIRVLVEASPDVIVTSAQPFAIKWSTGTRIATSDATYKFWRVKYDGSQYVVDRSTAWNGSWSRVASGTNYVLFTPGTAKLEVVFGSGTTRVYRGNVIARYYSTDGMRTINELALEQYLYGSVPHESPASWPAEELKAQAVAARTYAAYKKDAARANGNMFDICANTACQMYVGYATRSAPGAAATMQEFASSNDAVDATTGQIVTYNGKPILAEYSSSTGGYTAPGSVAYQKAVPDSGDAVSPHHSWTGAVTAGDVERQWPDIGRLVDVKVASRNGYGEWGGRVQSLQIVGTASTVTVSGGAWTAAFDWPDRSKGLQSTWFDPRYWRGELVDAPSAISLLAGATTTIPVQIRNSGNQPWPVGGAVRVTAASGSPFASNAWVSPTRPASVARNATDPSKKSVSPGEVAEFRIQISASGLAPGNYTQHFGTIVDGYSVLAPAFTTAIQVLPSWTEEAPNILANPSFEYGTGAWKTSGFTAADGISKTSPRDGAATLHFAGGSKSAAQTVSFAGGTARRFTLGGWTRSAGTNDGPVALSATATYADGTTQTTQLPFATGAHPWTYAETAFTTSAAKQLKSVRVAASVARQTGDVWFDALRLVESPVANPSFEQGMTGWGATGLVSGDGVVNSTARDGARALSLASTATESVTQVIALAGRRSERFAAGAWTRTVGTDANAGPMQISITFAGANGATATVPVDVAKAPHDWALTESSVVAPIDFASASITISRTGQTGTLYVDDVRVVRTWTQNSSFEGALAPWTTVGSGVTLGLPALDGSKAVTVKGAGAQAVKQRVSVAGGIGKRFVVSGWSRAAGTNPSAGFLGIKLVFHNTDGSLSTVAVPFSRAPHQWAFAEALASAPKAFSGIDVVALIDGQTGSASFDGIRIRSF
jgi:stage II sporulation protein D